MNVAIFTDNDFDKINGVTTTLTAALRYAPSSLRLRVYTAGTLAVDTPEYLAVRSFGMPIPFYRDMRMYLPRLFEFVARARADRIDVIHLTTPGPIGLAALFVAWRLRLPIVGSFHTDLAAYATTLSGSTRLGSLMREYMRWPYGKCVKILAPSSHTRRLLIDAKADPAKVDLWQRGVDTVLFSPAKAFGVAARQLARVEPASGAALRRPCSKGKTAADAAGRAGSSARARRRASVRDRRRGTVASRTCSGGCPMRCSPDRCRVRRSPRSSRRPTCSSFRAALTLPVTWSSKRRPAVFLSIISGTGGPRENMVAGRTGTVCHLEDPDEWSSAIAGVLRDPARHAEMRVAARQYALTRTWELAMQPLYRSYQDAYMRSTAARPSDAVHAPAHGI